MKKAWKAFRAALPSLRTGLFGSMIWCVAISLCVWFNTRLMASNIAAQRVEILLIAAAGAFLAFAPSVTLANLIAGTKRQSQLMAAHLIGLTVLTLGMTALIHLFQFRSYFAIWHDTFGSRDWFWQQFFTTASAMYQFAVLGTRLYLPWGPVVLIGAAYVLSTKRL